MRKRRWISKVFHCTTGAHIRLTCSMRAYVYFLREAVFDQRAREGHDKTACARDISDYVLAEGLRYIAVTMCSFQLTSQTWSFDFRDCSWLSKADLDFGWGRLRFDLAGAPYYGNSRCSSA